MVCGGRYSPTICPRHMAEEDDGVPFVSHKVIWDSEELCEILNHIEGFTEGVSRRWGVAVHRFQAADLIVLIDRMAGKTDADSDFEEKQQPYFRYPVQTHITGSLKKGESSGSDVRLLWRKSR